MFGLSGFVGLSGWVFSTSAIRLVAVRLQKRTGAFGLTTFVAHAQLSCLWNSAKKSWRRETQLNGWLVYLLSPTLWHSVRPQSGWRRSHWRF